jgi:hypothetical protein
MKPKTWIWVLACVAGPAFSHGGGLDSEGCHTNRKTGDYHCHRGSNSGQSSGADSRAARAPAATPQQSTGPTCYTGPRGGTYTLTKSGRKNYSGC